MSTAQIPLKLDTFTQPHINYHKATITQIGKIVDGRPVNFEFDCRGTIPGIEIRGKLVLYGGYTVSELAEIARAN